MAATSEADGLLNTPLIGAEHSSDVLHLVPGCAKKPGGFDLVLAQHSRAQDIDLIKQNPGIGVSESSHDFSFQFMVTAAFGWLSSGRIGAAVSTVQRLHQRAIRANESPSNTKYSGFSGTNTQNVVSPDSGSMIRDHWPSALAGAVLGILFFPFMNVMFLALELLAEVLP